MAVAVEPVIAFEPESAASDVAPGEPVTVTVADGRLTEVTLTDARRDKVVPGEIAADGLSWTSSVPTKVAKHYRIHAAAEDATGTVTTEVAPSHGCMVSATTTSVGAASPRPEPSGAGPPV